MSTLEATSAQHDQPYLAAHLERVRRLLEQPGEHPDESPAPVPDAAQPEPPLERVRRCFGLSPFERDVLLLCAGVELDPAIAAACARAGGDGSVHPTFGLALTALPDAHWSALAPGGPLRYWRLVEVGSGDALTRSRLAIDERILHFLVGVATVDERATGLLTPLAPADGPAEDDALVARLAAVLGGDIVVEVEVDAADRVLGLASHVAAALGGTADSLRAGDIPSAAAERETLSRLCEREARLTHMLLAIDACDPPADAGPLTAFVDRFCGPVIVAAGDPLPLRSARVRLPRPAPAAQRDRWRAALDGAVEDAALERALGQFAVSARDLPAVAAQVRAGVPVWDACRAQCRPRLAGLAERIEPAVAWDDLVLPETPRRLLAALLAQVRHRSTVHDAWGWSRESRGLGTTALFAGPSGTGKTMAAEVLAGELGLDLYRIDLSAVVSKYIGETEKNLRRVFDAAEAGGAVLAFDEADALFGKRSEVRDSHDRYANIEVSYLLQRMEAYRGLALLTTNQRQAIDGAFLRRLRFVVTFPFPDAQARAAIWKRVFPPETPTEGLDAARLAKLSVTGGSIRAIALNASFLAADAGEPVRHEHILEAARMEYGKHDRPIDALD